MRLVRREIDKKGAGIVTLVCEHDEDMWHVYNLITPGDRLRLSTARKVARETATGTTTSERVRANLTIAVRKADYDPESRVTRFSGRVVSEGAAARRGSHHAAEIEMGKPFSVAKDHWDAIALERLSEACDPRTSADVAAVVLDERGTSAAVCLVGASTTSVRARVEGSVPRKRGAVAGGQHAKALSKFFDAVLEALLRHVSLEVVQCVVVASPGFTKDQLVEHIMAEATRKDLRLILDNKSKFITAHCSSGHVMALNEVLKDPAVAGRVVNTKAGSQVEALGSFYDTLKADSSRAVYGPRHVEYAHSQGAIHTLLLSDSLFRAKSVEMRKRYVSLVESVKSSGADVRIFSTAHPSGQQLDQLTGVAAILKWPLPELDEQVGEDDEGAAAAAGDDAEDGEEVDETGLPADFDDSGFDAL
eukprot:m51a1_g10582 putative protein pelota (419) ;mRNA; r:45549-47591